MSLLRIFTATLLLAAAAAPAAAQSGGQRANWALADRFSSENVSRVVSTDNVDANWILETDSLWYAWSDANGRRFHLVVPQGPRRQPLFDHQRLAELLSADAGVPTLANDLPLEDLEFEEGGRRITFEAHDHRFAYDLDAGTLVRLGEESEEEDDDAREWRRFSPDSTAWVYAEDHNLYVVRVVDGMQLPPVQLTTDGEEEYSFGSRDPDSPRGRGGFGQGGGNQNEDDEREPEPDSIATRVAPNATWSEDGQAFFVTRGDSRGIDVDLWVMDVLAEPRPQLRTYDKTLPGDPVPYRELHVYRLGGAALTELPQVHRWKDQSLTEIHWGADSNRLRLIRRDRPWQNLDLIEIDLPSGNVRTLISESMTGGRLEGGSGFGNMYQPRYLAEGGDFLWWSERTGWGHFYLHGHDGTLKHAVTSGAWRAENVEAIDSTRRVIWITGRGRESGENPNYDHIYRTSVDRPQLTLLNPGDYARSASLSPSRRFILDNYSRIDQPWVSVLRDASSGRVALELEAMDVSRLQALGWQPPEPFVVKAADGITDIFGNIFRPFDFDPNRRYPVIASVYPGPQTEGVSTGFSANAAQQRLAQLGFIVVQIGNRGGTPNRSASYRNYGFQNLRDYALADKKVGLEQLAARYPYMDLTRVGIFGHSGGGFLTGAALLVPPFNDFFTVGVASNGNHDNNVYSDYWAEQNHGLTYECVSADETARGNGNRNGGAGGNRGRAARAADDDTEGGIPEELAERRRIPGDGYCDADERVEWTIDVPTNADVAENLKGRLMVAFSDQDNNVHPANSVRLIHALITAGKRFDMLLLPGQAHGFGPLNNYFQRRRDEFFAEHLLGDDSARTEAVDIQ